jgi:hypothetical protein
MKEKKRKQGVSQSSFISEQIRKVATVSNISE